MKTSKALLGHLHADEGTPFGYRLYFDERTGGIYVFDFRSKVISAIRNAVDIQQMRADEYNVLGFALVDIGFPIVNSAVKQVHIA